MLSEHTLAYVVRKSHFRTGPPMDAPAHRSRSSDSPDDSRNDIDESLVEDGNELLEEAWAEYAKAHREVDRSEFDTHYFATQRSEAMYRFEIAFGFYRKARDRGRIVAIAEACIVQGQFDVAATAFSVLCDRDRVLQIPSQMQGKTLPLGVREEVDRIVAFNIKY